MQRSDLAELDKRLQQLADALNGRAPSAQGLIVWLDALQEFAAADVWTVITDWPKANSKMPVPLDVVRAARTAVTARIEKDASRNAAAGRDFSVARLRPSDPSDPECLRFKAWFAEFKRRPKARVADPKGWARKLLDQGRPDGEPLTHAMREMAQAAVVELTPRRELDEAERELLEERRAMQEFAS